MSSITRSHPLHIQRLRHAQGVECGSKIRSEYRKRAYDFRAELDARFYNQIRLAESDAQAALEQEHLLEYEKSKVVIDRFNLACTVNNSFGPVSFSAEQRQALLSFAFFAVQEDQAASFVVEFDLALVIGLDIDPSPPGLAIRETPRRPGAPSFADFHI